VQRPHDALGKSAPTAGDQVTFTINGQAIKYCDLFRYLGRYMTPCGRSSKDISIKLTRAHKKLKSLDRFLRSADLPRRMKRVLADQQVLTMLYAAETWCPTMSEWDRIQALQMRILRITYHLLPRRRADGSFAVKSNEAVFRITKHVCVTTRIATRRWKFVRQADRRLMVRPERQALHIKPLPGTMKRRATARNTWQALARQDLASGTPNPPLQRRERQRQNRRPPRRPRASEDEDEREEENDDDAPVWTEDVDPMAANPERASESENETEEESVGARRHRAEPSARRRDEGEDDEEETRQRRRQQPQSR
jgi:hypothetical protein